MKQLLFIAALANFFSVSASSRSNVVKDAIVATSVCGIKGVRDYAIALALFEGTKFASKLSPKATLPTNVSKTAAKLTLGLAASAVLAERAYNEASEGGLANPEVIPGRMALTALKTAGKISLVWAGLNAAGLQASPEDVIFGVLVGGAAIDLGKRATATVKSQDFLATIRSK